MEQAGCLSMGLISELSPHKTAFTSDTLLSSFCGSKGLNPFRD